MNLKNVLIIVGVIALILLIIQYVGQVRRMRQGDNFVSRGRAFVNWLLLFIIIGVSVVLSMLITTQSRILI